MNKKTKFYASLFTVLLLGVVVGWLGAGIYIKNQVTPFYKGNPGMRRAMILERLNSKLDLTPAQKVEIEKIIELNQKEMREFRRKHRPERKKIIDKRFALISEHLNEDQKEKLAELRKEWRKRMEKRRGFRDRRAGKEGRK